MLAFALVAVAACLVTAPVAVAGVPAAADDQYNPHPGGGGGNGGGNGNGHHHHHHNKATLKQKCHNKKYRKNHRRACHKALLHRAGSVASVSSATPSGTSSGSSGAAGSTNGGAAGSASAGSAGTAATSGAQASGPGTSGSEAQSGGGSLPFTGYPVTTLVWIMIGLVGAGLAIRLGWSAWERRRNLSV